MTKKLYIENKPWAIIASLSLTLPEPEQEVSFLFGTILEDGDSAITSKPISARTGKLDIVISPTSILENGIYRSFDSINDLNQQLLGDRWVVEAAEKPDQLLYAIIDAYGVYSYKYIKSTRQETLEYNRDLWENYCYENVTYIDKVKHNKVVGLNAIVLRYNRFNLSVMEKENPDLMVEINQSRGYAVLHVLGKNYKDYGSYMEKLGMRFFDTYSTRGGYLNMPSEIRVEDMDIQTVKESVKEFYNR